MEEQFVALLERVNIYLGVMAFVYPLVVALRFHRTTKLGGAIKWMFVGEAVGMLGILIFAVAAHTGYITDVSGLYQGLLRFTMFFIAFVTTIHLMYYLDIEIDARKRVKKPEE